VCCRLWTAAESLGGAAVYAALMAVVDMKKSQGWTVDRGTYFLFTLIVMGFGWIIAAANTGISYLALGMDVIPIITGFIGCCVFVIVLRFLHHAWWLAFLSLLPAVFVLVGSVQYAPEAALDSRGVRETVRIAADSATDGGSNSRLHPHRRVGRAQGDAGLRRGPPEVEGGRPHRGRQRPGERRPAGGGFRRRFGQSTRHSRHGRGWMDGHCPAGRPARFRTTPRGSASRIRGHRLRRAHAEVTAPCTKGECTTLRSALDKLAGQRRRRVRRAGCRRRRPGQP
jgi:hypothetical protein